MSQAVDVVVIGGGPGGSATATLIARAGHHVIQLERERHPRHHVGASLLPVTVHGIGELMGVRDQLLGADFVSPGDCAFHWRPDAGPWPFPFRPGTGDGTADVFHTPRADFDALLFAHARASGVDARDGVEAVSSLRDGDGRVVGVVGRDSTGRSHDLRARFVVDASGRAGTLAGLAGRRIRSRFFRNVGVYGYYAGPGVGAGRALTADFEHGWCWTIPTADDLAAVGAVVDHRHAAAIERHPAAALEGFVDACPVVSRRLEEARRVTAEMCGEVRVDQDWTYRNEACWVPGLLLVGDAAGGLDPVLPAGIHLATYSGLLAARSINAVLERQVPERRAMEEFDRRCRREFRCFYELLVAFYDMPGSWDSYYWSARTLLATPERGNAAFIEAVADAPETPESFLLNQAGAGVAFAGVLAGTDPDRAGNGTGHRVVTEGLARMLALGEERSGSDADAEPLTPSADGLRWELPEPG